MGTNTPKVKIVVPVTRTGAGVTIAPISVISRLRDQHILVPPTVVVVLSYNRYKNQYNNTSEDGIRTNADFET